MFVPLILIGAFVGWLIVVVTKRKGVGSAVAIIGAFPMWAVFFGIWLASKTDKIVLEKLGLTEKR
jgi:hypothetical protein